MKIIRVFEKPGSFNHTLPDNVIKHCQIHKQPKNSLLAWHCLSKYIDLNKVKFTKNGKPYLLSKSKYVSISHSSNKIAIAVSDVPIGIDIEKIVSNKVVNTLAKRLLDKKQLEVFKKTKNKCLWFTKYWTQYEAVLKMLDMKKQTNLATTIISKITVDKKNQKYVMSYAYINKKRD